MPAPVGLAVGCGCRYGTHGSRSIAVAKVGYVADSRPTALSLGSRVRRRRPLPWVVRDFTSPSGRGCATAWPACAASSWRLVPGGASRAGPEDVLRWRRADGSQCRMAPSCRSYRHSRGARRWAHAAGASPERYKTDDPRTNSREGRRMRKIRRDVPPDSRLPGVARRHVPSNRRVLCRGISCCEVDLAGPGGWQARGPALRL